MMIDMGKPKKARGPWPTAAGEPDALTDLAAFGPNPGALRAKTYVPARLQPRAALVVVLHGCLQDATSYDRGSGWSTLAEAHGFALLFAEQRRENNANVCLNWFQPGDTRRDHGEVASIRAMIAAVVATHAIDPARVFVTGLSAGGAMTGALLAAYPEVFAGGAILAGLPVGAAANVQQAMAAMRGGTPLDPAARTERVLEASAYRGPWPRVSVWHGDADQVVAPANGDAVVAQWRGVHGLAAAPDRTERANGGERRVWRDAGGREVVEQWRIAGMGHGTPIAADGAPGGGLAMPYMLNVGTASTRHIAVFWGLIPQAAAQTVPETAARPDRPARVLTPEPLSGDARSVSPKGVAKVIDSALRAAGLVK